MPTKPAQPVKDELAHYGVPPGVVRTFDGREATSDLIDYLDLVESPRRLGANEDVRPDGVAEVQGRPLLFFVNESRLATSFLEQPQQLEKLSRALACRGDQAYLARIRPGELLVAKVSLTRREPQWRPYTAGTGDAITFFSRLAHGIREDAETDTAERRSVFQEMLRLLNNAANKLATGLPPADVLSLIGRSLFFRFLIDRGVVAPHDLGQVCPAAGSLEDCFVDAQSAQQTCAWLDRTFNGDFLPLSGDGGAAFFANLGGSFPATFTHLTAIMQRWDPAGGGYQGKLRWAKFDFAHVPVGLLSQVYEAFCWEWEHRTSKATSVHYTPRHLATTLVEEAFDGLPRAQDARVLDCACGAGVFLVLAFRRLYQERWAATGVRPDTKAIRAILERQLAGFDISESALKLAALSLYLTAIELDPVPVPPEKLRFKDPMGTVLFNHRRPEPQDPADGPVLGSLGPHVNRRFDGQFDVVLSNPPWTSLSEKFKDPLTSVCRDVLSRAGERELAGAYSNPDIEPDLPFVLRSTEWCRPGGRIAMALPARILLKQADTPRRARETLFKLIQVTGIINGSNLADTDVWPGMSQPFMLLFAVNQRPIGSHVVRFITPQYDERLNRGGQLAIDSKSAQPLRLSETTRYPWFWKAHAVGTVLDIEVTRRLMEAHAIPLKEYWGKEHLGLVCGKGFQDAPKQKQQAAPFMRKYPELSDTRKFRFLVDTTQLELSVRRKACFPRKEEIYAAPLVLIKESPGPDRASGWGLLSFSNVLYSESFCGYSAAGHPDGELLVRYMHLFVHSSIWMHYSLLTSAKFGAERRRVYKEDIHDCPIVPLDKLTSQGRADVLKLSKRLVAEDPTVFGPIDTFFGQVYGLDDLDLEVIRDTLAVSLPYDTSRQRAWAPPTASEQFRFCRRLAIVLKPFFEAMGKRPHVSPWTPGKGRGNGAKAPYGGVLISGSADSPPLVDERVHALVLRLGEETGSTRIIEVVDGALVVAILAQYRYWTPSRARLLGIEIVRRHLGLFEG